ncbi:MAG TPA: hypothetical protein VGF84_03500 [Micromonosporaceae bacterium]|jgi:hypothetical protein
MSQHYARGPALYVQAKPSRLIPALLATATLILVAVIGGVTGVTLFGSGGAASSTSDTTESRIAAGDVKLTKCAVDPGKGWPRATLMVTNNSTVRASYVVTIAFQSDDGATQYSSASTSVQALAPGQKATAVAEGLTTAPHTFTCAVASVNRE